VRHSAMGDVTALGALVERFQIAVRALRRDATAYKILLDGIVDDGVRRRLIAGRCKDNAHALELAHKFGSKALAAISVERASNAALAGEELDGLVEEFNAFETFIEDEGLMIPLPSKVLGESFVLPSEYNPESALESSLAPMLRVLQGECDSEDIKKRSNVLDAIIFRLNSVEQDFAFKTNLAAEVRDICAEQDWTFENCAYGSTPYASWARLFEHDALKDAIARVRKDNMSYVVWGSSTGWLVFFGSLTFFGVPSMGVEILQTLHDTATRVLDEMPSKYQSASFRNEDMLSSSLESVGIVLLTSCCWDESVHEAACERLAKDLLVGSIVIDYGDRLSNFPAFGKGPIFTEVCPTSWNPKQKFFVYQKE
jgi:hypothetical protein